MEKREIKQWYFTPALLPVQALAECADTQGWYHCSDGNQYEWCQLNRIHPVSGKYAESPIDFMIEVDWKQFQGALKKVVKFRLVNYLKHVGTSALEGAQLICAGDKMQVVACDGKILAIVPIDAKVTSACCITLQYSTIKSLLALSCAGLLVIVRRDGKEFFRCGEISLWQETAVLKYPDVYQVMPKDSVFKTTLCKNEVKKLIKSLTEGKSDVVNFDVGGLKVCFVTKPLLKILKAVSGDVRIETRSENHAIRFTDERHVIFVCMPAVGGSHAKSKTCCTR